MKSDEQKEAPGSAAGSWRALPLVGVGIAGAGAAAWVSAGWREAGAAEGGAALLLAAGILPNAGGTLFLTAGFPLAERGATPLPAAGALPEGCWR